jgi:hypothetical protein
MKFNVRDGIILNKLRIENNLEVRKNVLKIKKKVKKKIMWRYEIEIKLKCLNNEDRKMKKNWKESVKLYVNEKKISIDSGEKKK